MDDFERRFAVDEVLGLESLFGVLLWTTGNECSCPMVREGELNDQIAKYYTTPPYLV